MSERLETVVVVTDRGSQTFTKVGDSATKMGTTIDRAATTGSTAMGRLSKTGVALGGAFSALQGTMTEFARAGAEVEASNARLETAIDNTGHSILEYQDAIEAAGKAAIQLGFDDEKAKDSIAILTTATGDASKAIQDVAIAEDIARARGISLANATRIVVAAEQGRLGALNRVGIQLDANATREERMDALQQRFAGNADAYAQTTAGAMDRVQEQFKNVEESIGGALGPFQTLIALAPGLSVGYTTAAAAIGALAPEMTAATAGAAALDLALGPVGIVAAALAAGVAIFELSRGMRDEFVPAAHDSDDALKALTATVDSFVSASSPLTPLAREVQGDFAFIQGAAADYEGQLHSLQKTLDDQKQKLQEVAATQGGEGSEAYKIQQRHVLEAQGALDQFALTMGKNEVNADQLTTAMTDVDMILHATGDSAVAARSQLQYLHDEQVAGRLSWQDYLTAIIDLGNAYPDIVAGATAATGATDKQTAATTKGTDATKEYVNTLTGYMQAHKVLGDQLQTLDGTVQSTTGSAAVLGDQYQTLENDSGDLAARTRDYNAALREQMGGYYGLADGIITARDAHDAFKQTQDNLIGSEGQYTGQLGEYNTQLGYVNDAVDLLNQRQAEGIPLTQQQTDFLAGAASAQERLQGGTEDATIALGIQAEQYAENMKIGDEMNQKLGDQTGATETLNATIGDLILALQGIPGYVKSEVDVQTGDAADRLARINSYLDSLNGKYANAVINVGLTGPGVGYTLPQYATGGIVESRNVIPHAQGGMLVRMNESGGEAVRLPTGALVFPAGASAEMAKRAGGGGGFTLNHPVFNIYANSPDDFADQMRAQLYGSRV